LQASMTYASELPQNRPEVNFQPLD